MELCLVVLHLNKVSSSNEMIAFKAFLSTLRIYTNHIKHQETVYSRANTPGKLSKAILIFQSIVVQSQSSVGTFNWEIRADWESNVVHHVSGLVNTLCINYTRFVNMHVNLDIAKLQILELFKTTN